MYILELCSLYFCLCDRVEASKVGLVFMQSFVFFFVSSPQIRHVPVFDEKDNIVGVLSMKVSDVYGTVFVAHEAIVL